MSGHPWRKEPARLTLRHMSMLPRASSRLLLVVATTSLLAACGATNSGAVNVGKSVGHQTETAEAMPDDGPLITLTEESNAWPAAGVNGWLTERQGCLLIDDAIAVFPLGTDWTPPSVNFPNGESVLVDSRVRLGGGWFELQGVTQEDLPLMPVEEVRECSRRTGATQYVWAAP